MKLMRCTAWIIIAASMALVTGCTTKATPPSPFPIDQPNFQRCFGSRQGCFIMIRCSDGKTVEFNPTQCDEKLPPCSTFKIWNTLIGLETGVIKDPDAPFYKWDGQERFIAEWNRDQTLREAFRVSCVPAFQNLARHIGPTQMQSWLDKLEYGDRNITAGVDVFWLSSSKYQPLLITPRQQVNLLSRLAKGEFPISEKSRAILDDILLTRNLGKTKICGKTGTGVTPAGANNLGWYVGYVREKKETYAFACVLQGTNMSGMEARKMAETIIIESGWR